MIRIGIIGHRFLQLPQQDFVAEQCRRILMQLQEQEPRGVVACSAIAEGADSIFAQAALKLQQLGVISYSRGLIKVLDRQKLETLSCECYGVVKKETELLLHYLPQRVITSGSPYVSA